MPITQDKRVDLGLDPITVDWSKFEKNPERNPKDVPVGSVAYYIRKRDNRYFVDFGIVYEHYSDCVVLQKITFRDRRLVISEFTKAPVPFKDFPHQTEWRKLPKGWSWDTQLFRLISADMPPEEADFKIRLDDPATIIEAYNRGYLVNVRDVPPEHLHSIIERENGYKIVKERDDAWPQHYGNHIPPDTVGIDFLQCFGMYEAAKAACDRAEGELQEQAEMSDLDWAIHLIDADLNRWQAMYSVSEENKQRARKLLMRLDNLENVETKVDGGYIWWRMFGLRRWRCVPIE